MSLREPRFVVSSVTGADITPERGTTTGNHHMPTSYYVRDTWHCFHTVAAFDAADKQYMGRGDARRKRLAEECCAELNRGHAEAMRTLCESA